MSTNDKDANNNKPRVFFPAEHGVRFDTEPAEKYGVRTYLLNENINPFNVEHVFREIERALDVERFNPVRDFIAMTGNYALVSFLVATAFRRYDRLQLLMFDAVTGEYRLKRVRLKKSGEEKKKAAR